jgi:hypothetical protein
MRSKEFITELFEPDKASKLTWRFGGTQAVTNINSDTYLVINFLEQEDDYDSRGIEFHVNGEFGMTGEGNVSEIFATVIEAVKEFVQNKTDCDSLYFTAQEKSRARMYDTLAKRVAKKLGWHVVPYEDMMADEKYDHAKNSGGFVFAIEKGAAPEHRQAAQQPQHGTDFPTIYYVFSQEFKELPTIKIQAKTSWEAEAWVKKNVPEYKNADVMGMFAAKVDPKDRPVIDKGIMPEKPKPIPQDPNSLGARLRAKLDEPK